MRFRAPAPALVLAAALLAIAAAFAPPASAQTNNLKVQRIADGVWVATPDRGANVSWFLASDGVVVVDAGNDAEIARAVLAKIAETAAKPVRFVIITHAHGDHASGAPVFAATGARIVCHENAAPAVANLLTKARAADPKASDGGVLALADRIVFLGGGRRAAVYYLGAGHTNGDLVVLLPEDKVLFAGDPVLNGRLPYLQSEDADPRGWEQIVGRLAALDVDKVVPGHGDVGTRQSVSDTYVYLKKVNELATQFIQTSVPDNLYEMKLREPDNRITNVNVTPDHIANVRAAVKLERARLERVEAAAKEKAAAPAAPKSPTPAPTRKPS